VPCCFNVIEARDLSPSDSPAELLPARGLLAFVPSPFFSMTVQNPSLMQPVANLGTPSTAKYFSKAFSWNALPGLPGLPCRRTVAALKWALAHGFLLYGRVALPVPAVADRKRSTVWPLATDRAGHRFLTNLPVDLRQRRATGPKWSSPADATIDTPPADLLHTKAGWAEFASGFWLGGAAAPPSPGSWRAA